MVDETKLVLSALRGASRMDHTKRPGRQKAAQQIRNPEKQIFANRKNGFLDVCGAN
jgi:hypothetical protein